MLNLSFEPGAAALLFYLFPFNLLLNKDVYLLNNYALEVAVSVTNASFSFIMDSVRLINSLNKQGLIYICLIQAQVPFGQQWKLASYELVRVLFFLVLRILLVEEAQFLHGKLFNNLLTDFLFLLQEFFFLLKSLFLLVFLHCRWVYLSSFFASL